MSALGASIPGICSSRKKIIDIEPQSNFSGLLSHFAFLACYCSRLVFVFF